VQNGIGTRVEIGILNISTIGPINDENLILYGIFVIRMGLCGRQRRTLVVFFVEYFMNLYTSQGLDRVVECLANVEPEVTPEMNGLLLQPFVEEEVWEALFQMHPLKSLGPDGHNAGFYQKA
jgi:hypothetical protein